MQLLRDTEIGVMFWAGRDAGRHPGRDRRRSACAAARSGSPAIYRSPALRPNGRPRSMRKNFTVVTAFAAYNGESYADIPTVQRTVGFIPRRDARRARAPHL